MYDFCLAFTTGLHLKPSEKFLQEYSGSKNSGFQKDVESVVEKLYGSMAAKKNAMGGKGHQA